MTQKENSIRYDETYRAAARLALGQWLAQGESGAVIGLPGVGRTTLLTLLVQRPDHFLPVENMKTPTVMLPIDLHLLPDKTLMTFYRTLFRAFYQSRTRFPPALQQIIAYLYERYDQPSDAFAVQSGLLELLELLHQQRVRTVWVMNNLDSFCTTLATREMTVALRTLRDKYKETIVYVAGMMTEIVYVGQSNVIAPLYDLLDSNVYWLPALSEANSQQEARFHLRNVPDDLLEEELPIIWQLTGGIGTLIRTLSHWRNGQEASPTVEAWHGLLQAESMKNRLQLILDGLTQVEQLALAKLVNGEAAEETDNMRRAEEGLRKKGLVGENGRILSQLLEKFVQALPHKGRGTITYDDSTDFLYQGQTLLQDLTPQERTMLKFLVVHPYQQQSMDQIIEATWNDVAEKEAVSTDSVYQTIRGLRKKLEPEPSKPVYIVNQRGGYRFFPEGKPVNS